MLTKDLLSLGKKDFVVSNQGLQWFGEFGLDIEALKGERRAFARQCLDWTERQYHLARPAFLLELKEKK